MTAIKNARRTSRKLRTLYARLGSASHPRGAVFSEYRRTRRALRGNLADVAFVALTLSAFRRNVETAVNEQFAAAEQLGQEQAERDATLYGLALLALVSLPRRDALRQTMAEVDKQIAAIRSGAVDEARLLGDTRRVGLFSPGAVTVTAAEWLTRLAVLSYTLRMGEPDGFEKVAVAVLDANTTDCCTRVNGQRRPLGEPFNLTGTPRFADQMEYSPFHHNCRTTVALVPIGE